MTVPVFVAKPIVEHRCTLGEGIFYDEKTKLVHWVDIDEAEVHSYDPATKGYTITKYPETGFVTALAPRNDGPGFIAAIEDSIVYLTPALPTGTATEPERHTAQSTKTVLSPIRAEWKGTVRFNDGAADPAGRFIIGSMTRPEIRDGTDRGELYSVNADGEATVLFDGIHTSNGLGWSPDNKIFYYIDSGLDQIHALDYDLATGKVSNRRTFATPPPPAPGSGATAPRGAFDGLTVDGVGNVWAARWADGRIVGFNPSGELIAHILTPGACSPTIPSFGGDNLDIMYIATASAALAGLPTKEEEAKYPLSGQVFAIDFDKEGVADVARVGGEWKGRGRGRFSG